MSVPEFPRAVDSSELVELRAAHRSLRTAFQVLAVGILILCGALFIYLFREVVVSRRQIDNAARFLSDYEKSNAGVMMEDFQARLYQFSRTNADFEPIYRKYFGTNAPAQRVLSAPATNQPITAP